MCPGLLRKTTYLVQTENTNNTNVWPVALSQSFTMWILLGGWPSHRPIGLHVVTYKWWVLSTTLPNSVICLGWDSILHWSALLGGFQVVQHFKEHNLCFGSWDSVCPAEEPNSAKSARRQLLLQLFLVVAL